MAMDKRYKFLKFIGIQLVFSKITKDKRLKLHIYSLRITTHSMPSYIYFIFCFSRLYLFYFQKSKSEYYLMFTISFSENLLPIMTDLNISSNNNKNIIFLFVILLCCRER